jgi:hypothetical protein
MTDVRLANILRVSKVTVHNWRKRGMPNRSSRALRSWALEFSERFRVREFTRLEVRLMSQYEFPRAKPK